MSGPKWTNVKLPAGAMMRNWPLLVGGGFSVVILAGLFLTAPPAPPPVDDVLGLVEQRDTDIGITGTAELAAPVDAAARRAAAERARRQREQEQQQRREQALAGQREREAQAELRRTRELLERYRAAQAAGETDVTFQALGAGNADAAGLRESLALEHITRENQAPLAPLVVSSARQFSGGRSHPLSQHPPQTARLQVAAPSGAAAVSVPPAPYQAPTPPGFPPGSPGTVGMPGMPGAPGVSMAPQPPGVSQALPIAPVPQSPVARPPVPVPVAPGGGGGVSPVQGQTGQVPTLGAPVGRVGRGEPGTFDIGPSAQGQGAPPPEVVVTPNDGIHYRLYEGTLLPAALVNRIQGDFSGPVEAQVTRPVYSRDRQRVLVPVGTKVLGTSTGAEGPFQERLAVGFHRMIFPDGRWVALAGPGSLWGLNAMGESSLRDQVNRHYFQAFGTAGAIGLLAALSQGGGGGQQGYGMQSALSQNASQVALQMMSRFLNRRPTVTIRAGHRLNIRMMTDVIIPAEVSRNLE